MLGTGRGEEARRVIAELNNVPEDDALVIEIVEELDYAIKAENDGGKATWLECFSPRNAMWRRTINGMMLQFIQQLNGQNFYCASNVLELHIVASKFIFFLFDRLLWGYFLRECGCRVSQRGICVVDTFSLKAGSLSPYVIQTILGAVSVVGTLPALYFIEAWGRRKVRSW